MRTAASRLQLATELLNAGFLCKCPAGPIVQVPTEMGWEDQSTVAHLPDCEAGKTIMKILNFNEDSPEPTIPKEEK